MILFRHISQFSTFQTLIFQIRFPHSDIPHTFQARLRFSDPVTFFPWSRDRVVFSVLFVLHLNTLHIVSVATVVGIRTALWMDEALSLCLKNSLSCEVKSLSCVRLCDCTRLLPPWDSPGKSTGVGCHFLLQLSCEGGSYLSCEHRRSISCFTCFIEEWWVVLYQAKEEEAQEDKECGLFGECLGLQGLWKGCLNSLLFESFSTWLSVALLASGCLTLMTQNTLVNI